METYAEQYYPTYKAQNRDVLLLEFEEAQRIANGQAKVYGQVTNILLAFATVVVTIFLKEDNKQISKAEKIISENNFMLVIIMFLFGALLLRYFVDLQRQITINARKVVTLRTLLGLDYGSIHLTLPNWRVEGATNPFNIKYFYGWLNFQSTPFWLITVCINVIYYFSIKSFAIYPLVNEVNYLDPYLYGHFIITTSYIYIFRVKLFDSHENIFLLLSKFICSIIRINLLKDFEYILYRAKLSYIELDRLKVDYNNLKKVLIKIEDQKFNSSKGFSIRSLVRGGLSQIKFFRKQYGYIQSGGSTITMQLSRTLFIPSGQNKYRRKIAEILISIWLRSKFSKEEILKIYISSVRYEGGIYGLAQGMKYFFKSLRNKKLSNEESFFLAERLSNITSTVNKSRIDYLVNKLSFVNRKLLDNIYEKQISENRLKK